MSDSNNALFLQDLGRVKQRLDQLSDGADSLQLSALDDALKTVESAAFLVRKPILAKLMTLLRTLISRNDVLQMENLLSALRALSENIADYIKTQDEQLFQNSHENLASYLQPDKVTKNPLQNFEKEDNSADKINTGEQLPIIQEKKSSVGNEQVNQELKDLFAQDASEHLKALEDGILDLEQGQFSITDIEALMRAAHSYKGASRVVGFKQLEKLAHILEDYFSLVGKKKLTISLGNISVLLNSVDALSTATQSCINNEQAPQNAALIKTTVQSIKQLIATAEQYSEDKKAPESVPSKAITEEKSIVPSETVSELEAPQEVSSTTAQKSESNKSNDSTIRVNAQTLSKMLGLSQEVLINAGRLESFASSLLTLKRDYMKLLSNFLRFREVISEYDLDEYSQTLIQELSQQFSNCLDSTSNNHIKLDEFDRQFIHLTSRLNREVVKSRMRPFSEGTSGYRRLIRDLSSSMGKKIQLNIEGMQTQVDRDILEKLETPLTQLVRNAVDHGIEKTDERLKQGKPETGNIYLKAFHNAGFLSVILEDDGKGIDTDALQKKLIEKNLLSAEIAPHISNSELLDFLFLPGFSTRDEINEISGRGFGLDIVKHMVQQVRGC